MASIRIQPTRYIYARRIATPRSLRARLARGIERVVPHATRLVVATLLLLFVASAASSKAFAASTLPSLIQSLESIRAAAAQHVLDKAPRVHTETLVASAAELDSRLRLETCGAPLRTFTLNNAPIAARTTIGVRCDVGATWTVYVPVSVESEINALVLRHDLPRGAAVAATDVESQQRRVPGLASSYITDAAGLRDRHLKRAAVTGNVLVSDLFDRNLAVKRGQQVLLVLDVKGLTVQAPGLALSDGSLADRIRVQNQTSLKIVEGVVESGNLVRVGM